MQAWPAAIPLCKPYHLHSKQSCESLACYPAYVLGWFKVRRCCARRQSYQLRSTACDRCFGGLPRCSRSTPSLTEQPQGSCQRHGAPFRIRARIPSRHAGRPDCLTPRVPELPQASMRRRTLLSSRSGPTLCASHAHAGATSCRVRAGLLCYGAHPLPSARLQG